MSVEFYTVEKNGERSILIREAGKRGRPKLTLLAPRKDGKSALVKCPRDIAKAVMASRKAEPR